MAHFIGRLEKSIPIMYGKEDLSLFPVFQGGFINFGYWDTVPNKPTKEQRISASHRLYEEIFNRLAITSSDKILEVGCGLGHGCLIALDQYKAKDVWGLDATPEQIERCNKAHAQRLRNGRLHFVEGFASKMPFPDNTFDKIYSVEAAQHFPSLSPFFDEMFRALKPGGKFALATFFRQPNASLKEIGQWIQTVEKEVDFLHPIDECRKQLKKKGFTDVVCKSIGDHVWKGFDKWHAVVAPNEWSRNFFKIYKKGLIDYCVLEGVKPR